jgi:hypothetical protein
MVTLVRRHARARWAAARAKQDEAARVGDDHEGDHVTAAASMLADGYSAA